MGLHEADDHGAGLELADLFEAERRDGQQHVGLRQDRRRTTGPFALLVEGIGELRPHAGAGLEQHARARGDELVDHLGYEADASFTGRALAQRAYRDRHLA